VSATLIFEVPDPDGQLTTFGAGAKIYWERSILQTGPWTDATGNVALVTATYQYTVTDSSGSAVLWYRWRYGDAAATTYSAYQDTFQGGQIASYATVAQLAQRISLPDQSKYALLADILVAVSSQFEQECGRQFYRIPVVSGETVRLYDGNGSREFYLFEGVQSVSKLEVAFVTGGSFQTLSPTYYFLQPNYPYPDWPFTTIALSQWSTIGAFFEGYNTLQITGVFGWASVPALVQEAVLELSAKTWNESKTMHAGVVGLPEIGTVTIGTNRPDAWYRALQAYGRKAAVAL
jgi:hypothetical protein